MNSVPLSHGSGVEASSWLILPCDPNMNNTPKLHWKLLTRREKKKFSPFIVRILRAICVLHTIPVPHNLHWKCHFPLKGSESQEK